MPWTSTANIKGNTGATGPQGPQGIQGVTGPQGPRGLTWRGAWSSTTAYAVDDAVTYSGSSYRRQVAGTTSTAPSSDTTNWELLAAKGDSATVPTPDTWHIVGNAGEPAFLNGWTEFAVDDVGFIKDSAGVVHLRGRVVPGTAGTAAFQLPSGYRPADAITGTAAYAHNPPALSYINITTGGNVVIGTSTSGWIGLTTVHFPTA